MASDTSTTDTSTATDTPVVTADSNVHEITLDVKKSGQTINEPIVIRTDDTDDVIKVHLKKDGQPYTGITSATFYGTKQDLTIIANDPAYVKDDIITYFVPKEVANIGGKIKDAYFMIDGKISTENFVITVFKTVDFKGESKDYIPGLNNLIDKWNDTSLEWTAKLKAIDQAVKNINADKMINDKMNVLLETAKTSYMATFNKSVDDLNNVVKDLTSKEDIATGKGNELDQAIADVNQSISDVNAWLKEVQDKIISANADFTKAQQDSVAKDISTLKDSINDVQKTADGLKSQLTTIDGEIKAIDVPDLNAKVDSLDSQATDIKNKYDALQTQVDNSAVGTNLIVQSGLKAGYINRNNGGTIANGNNFYSDNYVATNGATVFTFSSPDYVLKGNPYHTLAMYDSNKNYLGYQNIASATQTLSNPNAMYIKFSINFSAEGGNPGNLSDWLDTHRYKLEKGSVATDWCPNPSEIATNNDVQTSITNALGNYSTSADVDSKISTGVGQAKTYAEQSIKDIIGAAPTTLDTIAELADAVTKNKDGVQAINEGITKKADKTDVTALQNTLSKLITPISAEDYKALEDAGKVDPTKLYLILEA